MYFIILIFLVSFPTPAPIPVNAFDDISSNECVLELSYDQRDAFLAELEGRLITWEGTQKVYVVENGYMRWIQDEPTFIAQGFSWEEITNAPCGLFRSYVYHGIYKIGKAVQFPYEERLIKFSDSTEVYATPKTCDYSNAMSPNAFGVSFCHVELHHIPDEKIASVSYGENWQHLILELDPKYKDRFDWAE